MEKKYYADVYFYQCPRCRNQVLGKMYYALYDLAEMGAAKGAGLITYRCPHKGCGFESKSNHLLTNGEAVEVSRDEAISNGLVYESKGQSIIRVASNQFPVSNVGHVVKL